MNNSENMWNQHSMAMDFIDWSNDMLEWSKQFEIHR